MTLGHTIKARHQKAGAEYDYAVNYKSYTLHGKLYKTGIIPSVLMTLILFFFKSVTSKFIIPYIGNYSRREILAKTPLGRCVKFSLSPIFAISKTLNESV